MRVRTMRTMRGGGEKKRVSCAPVAFFNGLTGFRPPGWVERRTAGIPNHSLCFVRIFREKLGRSQKPEGEFSFVNSFFKLRAQGLRAEENIESVCFWALKRIQRRDSIRLFLYPGRNSWARKIYTESWFCRDGLCESLHLENTVDSCKHSKDRRSWL